MGPLVYWFGGWTPRAGLTLGIGFVADQASAAVGVLVSVIFAASFVFAWGLFRGDPLALPRPHAAVPRSDDRVLPDARPVQPVRVVRGDEHRGVRADGVPVAGVGDRGGARLHGDEHARQLPDAGRHRAALREGGGARFLGARASGGGGAGRSGRARGVLPDRDGAAHQGSDGAVPFLAGGRAHGGAQPGVGHLLRGDGDARRVRDREARLAGVSRDRRRCRRWCGR